MLISLRSCVGPGWLVRGMEVNGRGRGHSAPAPAVARSQTRGRDGLGVCNVTAEPASACALFFGAFGRTEVGPRHTAHGPQSRARDFSSRSQSTRGPPQTRRAAQPCSTLVASSPLGACSVCTPPAPAHFPLPPCLAGTRRSVVAESLCDAAPTWPSAPPPGAAGGGSGGGGPVRGTGSSATGPAAAQRSVKSSLAVCKSFLRGRAMAFSKNLCSPPPHQPTVHRRRRDQNSHVASVVARRARPAGHDAHGLTQRRPGRQRLQECARAIVAHARVVQTGPRASDRAARHGGILRRCCVHRDPLHMGALPTSSSEERDGHALRGRRRRRGRRPGGSWRVYDARAHASRNRRW